MGKSLATSVCVVMAIAAAASFLVVRPCDLPFHGGSTGEAVVGASDGATSSPAILSGSGRHSFNPVYSRRVPGPNLAVTLAMATEHFLPRWRQAANPGCLLHPRDSSLFLLHCRLII